MSEVTQTQSGKEALRPLVRNIRAVAAYFNVDAKVLAERANVSPQTISYLFNEADRALTIPVVWACQDALLDIIGELRESDKKMAMYSNTITIHRNITEDND